jgi:hypothetical protein
VLFRSENLTSPLASNTKGLPPVEEEATKAISSFVNLIEAGIGSISRANVGY